MSATEHIRIRGTVQGVGFRPTVARIARAAGLRGWVRNDGEGVLVALHGDDHVRDRFVHELLDGLPPLARVDTVERAPADPVQADGFTIVRSDATQARTAIAADAAPCPACREEVLDPFARRYRYPFTNCTHCGPRFTIVQGIPYDRPNTTMAGFPLCDDCRAEYEDETDRRYHAQPVACGRCGPQAKLVRTDGAAVSYATFSMLDDVDAVRTLLQRGEIVAIKGLGGYQLCCDATNEVAVDRLRRRKHRPDKPLALMVENVEEARRFCTVSDLEERALTSPANPIVLLDVHTDLVAPSVAPHQRTLGLMLPATPLHQLVLRRIGRPIVCTSGNRSDEPQCIDDEELHERLGDIADWALVHDRPIAHRVDDSVVRVVRGEVRSVRRARGYAPAPLVLHDSFRSAPALTALGGHLKSTFCLMSEGRAVLSPHIGDLDEPRTVADYHHIHDTLTTLFQHQPARLVVDAHPGYATQDFVRGSPLPVDTVGHHHAHVAACLADNQRPVDQAPVLALVLDGLGMSDDLELWGGEVLVADYRSVRRVAGLPAVPLIGGDRAARQPWRSAVAHVVEAVGWEAADALLVLAPHHNDQVELALERAPRASSTGRLFDAVAAVLGIAPETITFEAQAPMALEALAADYLAENDVEPYLIDTSESVFDLGPMWTELLADVAAAVPAGAIAARFHRGLACALVKAAVRHRGACSEVALSGGVWQNALLLDETVPRLEAEGFTVLLHRHTPPNDGCISLGQACVAAARQLQE